MDPPPRKLEKPQQDVMKISTHCPRFLSLHKNMQEFVNECHSYNLPLMLAIPTRKKTENRMSSHITRHILNENSPTFLISRNDDDDDDDVCASG